MDAPQITRQTTAHRAEPRTIATTRGDFAALISQPDAEPLGTVLLVPGYTGSKEDFAPIIDPLTDRGYQVISIDQRGQYQSTGGADAEAYSVDALGADLLATAEALEARVHLVGHSFGGLVARAAVIADPRAFASLVLMSSGPSELPAGPRRAIIEASEPHLQTMGLAAIYDAGQQALAKDPSWQPPAEQLRGFLRERFVTGSPDALAYMGRAMLSEPDRVAELRATSVPAMVLYGAHDNAWSPESQSDMAMRLGAREVIVPDAVHSPAIENPAKTVEALAAFWNDYR